MLRSFVFLGLIAILPSLALLGGCSDSAELLLSHRKNLILADEPDGVLPVLEVREALLGVEPAHAHEHDHAEHTSEHQGHDHDEDEDEDEHEEEHKGHDHEEQGVAQVALPTKEIEVLLVGQIGGLPNPWKAAQPDFPFEKNQAKFFLADPGAVAGAEASGHSHAPGEECPICAAHAKDSTELLAVVQFLDKKGHVLPIDARELFDVKTKDTVVISGKARVTAGGILVVDATGIYIRR